LLGETNHINDELLIKYLLKETSSAETSEVESWLQQDAGHVKRFEEFKLIWEASRQLAINKQVDEQLAWKRMQERLHQKPDAAPIKKMQRSRIARMAAVYILLIAGAAMAGIYLFQNQQVQTQVVTAGNNILRDSLPDGSIVTLNKTSRLYYPEEFEDNSREVKLEGEAFFNITPDKEKPFIIKTGDVQITVIGTSFNVKNENGNTEVVVETGMVEVRKDSQSIRLMPEEKVVIKKTDKLLVKEEVEDKLYNYYASKEFVCVNTPLWKLVEILNEAYGVHIIISKKELKRLPLTTTFNNESLDQILEVISETFNISVERSGDTIILN
jgi:ferric-dicitrate binding protein FerR (iron transport regulator)